MQEENKGISNQSSTSNLVNEKETIKNSIFDVIDHVINNSGLELQNKGTLLIGSESIDAR